MANPLVKMPHYPKGIDREFTQLFDFMVDQMADRFKNQVILKLNKKTIDKFADAQIGNYAVIFNKLAKQATRKLLKQFSNERIEEWCKSVLKKANKYNRDLTYQAMEKALGIDQRQLLATEAMSPTINALILETVSWANKLRDDTLQYFTANTLRTMALGNTIDDILKEFDLEKSKRKEAARFIARNQLANFNGILTKIRFQKSGIEKARWKTTLDGKERECHHARNDQIFELSKGCFSKCDGKWLLPGSDYNCRCIMEAIIEEFEDL